MAERAREQLSRDPSFAATYPLRRISPRNGASSRLGAFHEARGFSSRWFRLDGDRYLTVTRSRASSCSQRFLE